MEGHAAAQGPEPSLPVPTGEVLMAAHPIRLGPSRSKPRKPGGIKEKLRSILLMRLLYVRGRNTPSAFLDGNLPQRVLHVDAHVHPLWDASAPSHSRKARVAKRHLKRLGEFRLDQGTAFSF